MKHLTAIVATCLFIAFSAPHALAGSQQDKMKTCNEVAGKKDLKGEERKKFMSECLSAKAPEKGGQLTPQQEKMKTCNKQASDKKIKGDERKQFMSDCLKG